MGVGPFSWLGVGHLGLVHVVVVKLGGRWGDDGCLLI